MFWGRTDHGVESPFGAPPREVHWVQQVKCIGQWINAQKTQKTQNNLKQCTSNWISNCFFPIRFRFFHALQRPTSRSSQHRAWAEPYYVHFSTSRAHKGSQLCRFLRHTAMCTTHGLFNLICLVDLWWSKLCFPSFVKTQTMLVLLGQNWKRGWSCHKLSPVHEMIQVEESVLSCVTQCVT